MHSDTWRRPWRAPILLLLLLCTVALAPRPAQAQPATPAVLQRAVDLLERDGYVASFAVTGGAAAISGEVRYQSPLAYSLLIEDGRGTGFEYVLLDTDLYSHDRDPDTNVWNGWQRRPWHPDAPIQAVIAYHPRLPLELLRAAQSLQDEGTVVQDGVTLRRLTGETSYYAALIASYEDQPSPTERQQRLLALHWQFTAWLDPATGALHRLAVEIPADDEAEAAAQTLTYTVQEMTAPLSLSAPPDAEQLNLESPYPEAPAGPILPLPVTLTGSGANVVTPIFTTTTGSFTVVVDPGIPDMQYTVLRVKRGRLLLASIGSLSGPGGKVTLPMTLAPGDYILFFAFPRSNDVTVTVTDTPAETPESQ